MPREESCETPNSDLLPLLIDVQSKLDEQINLESLARQFGYSPFHFHRFFSNAVGETPKQHVGRLRLERAAYKLAITGEKILNIALSVGFKNHETFSRAFKQAFGSSPRDYRRACRTAQAERLERTHGFSGDGCLLSDVAFVSMPVMTLLAIRRHGAYANCPMPFQRDDDLWQDLVDWANRHGISYSRLPLAISYDDPTVTPESGQRLDACLPIVTEARTGGRIRRLDFAGGRYAGIEHVGPLSTIDQAYRSLADGVRRSCQWDFDAGPPMQVFRKLQIADDPSASLTEVYFPVRPLG